MTDDDDVDLLVPSAFTVTLAGRDDDQPLKAWTFETLKNRLVVVRANGFVYRGRLVGADEEELYLRGELRWFVLPLSTVTAVKPDPDAPPDDDDDDDDDDAGGHDLDRSGQP